LDASRADNIVEGRSDFVTIAVLHHDLEIFDRIFRRSDENDTIERGGFQGHITSLVHNLGLL